MLIAEDVVVNKIISRKHIKQEEKGLRDKTLVVTAFKRLSKMEKSNNNCETSDQLKQCSEVQQDEGLKQASGFDFRKMFVTLARRFSINCCG